MCISNTRESRGQAGCFFKGTRHTTLFGNSEEATPVHFIKHSFGNSGKLGRCTAKTQFESDRGYFVFSINFQFLVYCEVACPNFFFLIEYSLYHKINFTTMFLLYLVYCSRHYHRNTYAFYKRHIWIKTFCSKTHII